MKDEKLIKKHRDDKLFRRKVKSRQKKRIRNRSLLGVSKEVRRQKTSNLDFYHRNRALKKLEAPRNFSLLENTEEVISFINDVDTCFEKKKNIFIDMDNVDKIAYGAIIVLLSKLVQFKAKKLDVNGSFPKNKEAKRVLKESGFIDYLYKDDVRIQNEYVINKKICTHANKVAEPALTARIIEQYLVIF